MLQNNINMRQNSIELLSGKWYNDFDEWGKVCRKRANVVFVAIFCTVFNYDEISAFTEQFSIHCRR